MAEILETFECQLNYNGSQYIKICFINFNVINFYVRDSDIAVTNPVQSISYRSELEESQALHVQWMSTQRQRK